VAGFTYTGRSPAISENTGNSCKVTIAFAATDPQVLVFGSTDTTANSARKLLAAKKAASSLTINLPAGSETISTGFTFTKNSTSPASVVINGTNRTLRLQSGSTGSIISVGNGVTLTLRDITLQGHGTNTAALVKVAAGGTLILEYVAIMNNTNTSTSLPEKLGGGVLVEDGGSLTMKSGTVTGNKAFSGGGVAVTGNATLSIKENATISLNQASSTGGGIYVSGPNANQVFIGESSIQENTAVSAGGGMYVYGTSVYMAESSVTGNESTGSNGGGVNFEAGTDANRSFSMIGGSILNNTANNLGGGVHIKGSASTTATLSMIGGEIGSNTAAPSKGAGVMISVNATFKMGETTKVAQNQMIYIWNTTSKIDIATSSSLYYDPAANIEGKVSVGDQVLIGNVSGGNNYKKFLLRGQAGRFDSNGVVLAAP
jgi:hypothetical protein